MPTITFIEYGGATHTVSAQPGATLMSTAVDNLVPGIDADCGGECSCATCHVMVDADWFDNVGDPQGAEEQMLDLAPDREHNSRLACQITLTPEHNGMVVRLPEFQM